jgi:hypothetical protein
VSPHPYRGMCDRGNEGEIARPAVVEVLILWDSNVLHVSHLTPPRSFYLGDDGQGMANDDCVPSEILGTWTTRAPIVLSQGLNASLVILPRSRGYVDVPSYGRLSLADLVSSGRARPSAEVSGGCEYELKLGTTASMELEGSALVFQVSAVDAAETPPAGFLTAMEPTALLCNALSFLVHASLLAVLAFFIPQTQGDDKDVFDRTQISVIQKLLHAAAQREQEDGPAQDMTEAVPDPRRAGMETSALATRVALLKAAQYGMIGLISIVKGGGANTPMVAWGYNSCGHPLKGGTMFGDLRTSFDAAGLGLSAVSEGGSRGEGIDLGVFAHQVGAGTGQSIGPGCASFGGRSVTSPRILEGLARVNGPLPPEIIRRIIRQNYGRFRLCHENGLRSNPNLQGRVTVKFVIDRSGGVQMTVDGGSDLPDPDVVRCVVRGFGNLSFPQPEGGNVTVVYPMVFKPHD